MDDIVTRLREIANDEVYMATISVSKLYEAADEIELLRDALIECESTISRLEIELKYKEVRGE